MSKSLSLMLSAALLAGSVASATPLAHKVTAAREGRQTAAEKVSPTTLKGPRMLTKALSSSRMKGLRADESGTILPNRRAVKSATAASSRSVASNINLRAVMTFSADWSEDAPAYGMYTVPASEGSQFDLVAPLETGYQYGPVDMGDGTFWGVDYISFWGMTFVTVSQLETDNWTVTGSQEGQMTIVAFDTALDPTSGDVYGCFYNEDGSGVIWGKADYPSGTSVVLGSLAEPLFGVGAAADGQYYGLGQSGKLYKINKANGALTEIGDTGVTTQYLTSGCVNDANSTFLFAVSTDNGGWLYEIDLATAEPTLLTEFAGGEEIAGLYIAKPAAADKAPAAPELTAACDGGSMDVKLTLTMPSTLFDGTPASGQTFNYSIKAGDKEVATGFAEAGKTVVRTVTMTEGGMTQFIATASNGDGVSPKAKASCYVGKGAPAAPADVNLAWANGTATLSWSAVTASSDGGYLDPSAVTYTVLSADGEALASGLTSTSWTTPVAEPADTYKAISYAVKSEYAGKQSAAVASNVIGLGAYSTPMTMALDGDDVADKFAQHIVFDANDNGKTWVLYSGKVCYRYHSSDPADDWLFSPAVNLEAGKIYTFKTTVYASSYTERLEVKAGMGTAPADMTTEIIAPTEITGSSSEPKVLTALIKPTASGRYNVGFHAMSDPDMNSLTLVSYEIGAAMDAAAPDVCSNILITPDASGALKAAVQFTAPKTDLSGNALSGNVSVKVLRGETEIKTFSGKSGMSYSFSDEVPLADTYTYTFIASNQAGDAGMPVSASAFIGPKTPASVSSAELRLTGENTLELTWEPVSTDVDGNPLPAGNVVKYNVYSVVRTSSGLALDEKLTAEPVEGTTFTCTADLPEEQDFYYLAIQSVNGTVPGGAFAASTIVGTPYDMPVVYTDEASLDSYFLYYGGTTSQRGQLSLAGEDKFGIPAADGDDCYFLISHTNAQAALGTMTYISTGKVLISGDYPVLSFWEYNVTAASQNETVVSVICDDQETVLTSYVSGNLPVEGGWNQVKVDLSAYKGKVVMLQIGSVLRSHLHNMFDCIEVKNNLAHDLSASISAPAEVATDEAFEVTVNVTNEGALENAAASVDLLRDGEVVETKTVGPIAPNSTLSLAFSQTLSKPAASADFSAVVNYAADEDTDNNTSAVVTVTRKTSSLPEVTGLAASRGEDGVALTWDAIDGEHLPVDAQTSDFENATSWNHEVEGWMFIDVDGEKVGGFQGWDIPGITPGTTTASFFVFDGSMEGLSDNYKAHSGSKYLAALFRYDDGQTNDWAISPELSGDAQTVSFWTKSFSADYPETVEILYSTTDTDIESFVVASEAKEVPAAWTEFSAKLPAGAKYFAIRSCATGSFMLMVDDVTYAPAGGVSSLELTGYNVYRDGVKINDAPLTTNSFVDTEAGDGAHTYHVAAVYNRGESEFSAPATVEESGIAAVLSAGVTVAVEGSEIVVTGAADKAVSIAAVDGKVVYSAAGDARVPVACGIYLVTVDGKTVKLIVK